MPKGQLFTLDILLASVLLLVVLSMLITTGSSLGIRLDEAEFHADLDIIGNDVLNQLIKSPGEPSNWYVLPTINSSQMGSIGLVDEDGCLDKEKLERFFSMSPYEYGETKVLLGLGSNHEFNATLSYINGTDIFVLSKSPSSPYPTYGFTNTTYSITTFAIYNKTIVKFQMNIWVE